jgi:hypothetical protein
VSERTVAQLNGNNVVINVVVVTADHELDAFEVEYTEALPAGIGWEYDGTGFIPPQPFASWQLVNYVWQPPVAKPDDGQAYYWDEDTTSWQLAE